MVKSARRKLSAGILLYRKRDELEVFLVHPGGPFWAKKDLGVWSIPKGEYAAGEDALAAAQREFQEETGGQLAGPFVALTPLVQASGKEVAAWAVEGDFDPSALVSNHCSTEWPPRSGKRISFPEVDRGEWFDLATAATKILNGQRGFLAELERKLAARG